MLWRVLPSPAPYDFTMRAMQDAAQQVELGTGREQVWLLESPAGYSRGGQARNEHMVAGARVKVDGATARPHVGGFWYHGPGVLGAVLILDLRARHKDIPGISAATHQWIGEGLQRAGASVHLRPGVPGVWADLPSGTPHKVAAVVLQVRRWITSYGAGINVNPDLAAFDDIAPCGAEHCTITSLDALGVEATMADVRAALRESFHRVFGPTSDAD